MAALHISRAQLDEMEHHAQEMAPLEACGLLGGTEGKVMRVVPVSNAAASPIRYRMDPGEQIRALFGFEEDGLELVGIYHSHPGGPNVPSQTDLSEAAYPEAVQLIWFKEADVWSCRAFQMGEGRADEVSLRVESVGSREE